VGFHLVTELGPKDFGESPDREIEIEPCGVPGAVFGGKGTAFGNVVDMGVVLESAPPGVEDPKATGHIGADMPVIASELLDRFGRGPEEGCVGQPLVAADEAAQWLRDGKGDHEMMTGKLTADPGFEPFSGLMVLTGGAVAIAAGAIDDVGMPAVLTCIASKPGILGAAHEDGVHGFAVLSRQSIAKAFQVLGAEGTEDVIDAFHIKSPP
jgi:hypothetical protein